LKPEVNNNKNSKNNNTKKSILSGEKEYQQGMMQVPGVSPYRFWLSSSFMLC
jgi:hypothetical protein